MCILEQRIITIIIVVVVLVEFGVENSFNRDKHQQKKE